MRHWFVVLLIVLLPWRAWAGDAMVLSMASSSEHTVSATSPASAVPHCAEHAGADDTESGKHTAHAVCDICNGPLLAVAAPVDAAPERLPPSRLAAGPVRFASALPHRGHKPPIS